MSGLSKNNYITLKIINDCEVISIFFNEKK